jgi:hypothetical protein
MQLFTLSTIQKGRAFVRPGQLIEVDDPTEAKRLITRGVARSPTDVDIAIATAPALAAEDAAEDGEVSERGAPAPAPRGKSKKAS